MLKIKGILREPLTHFLLAGLAIFLFKGIAFPDNAPRKDKIVITQAQIERLASVWAQTWGRAPSDQELQSIVREHITEEVYYREAKKLGLDLDDTVIRRRLKQKMEILSEGDLAFVDVPEGELKAFFEKNKENYVTPYLFAFEHIYLGQTIPENIESIIQQVEAGSDLSQIEKTINLPTKLSLSSSSLIARQFGQGFSQNLETLPAQEWAGAVKSGFGFHLVRITEKRIPEQAQLSEVRQQVENDLRAQLRKENRIAVYEKLSSHYSISIEGVDF